MNSLIINILQECLQQTILTEIKKNIQTLIFHCKQQTENEIFYTFENQAYSINKDLIINELNQISETITLERTHYYIQRLLKSLTEVKTLKINDLNLNRWKEYPEILTDSLWLFDKRDTSGAHSAEYWGNFIPQIPRQLLQRYTKSGDWVLDPFLGSGTTLIECKRLGRNGIGIELQKEVAELAQKNIDKEKVSKPLKTEIFVNDALELDYERICKQLNINQLQFVFLHPPYWDIIRFSENPKDFSSANTLEEFLQKIGSLVDKIFPCLEKGRFMALIISDKYEKGEWVPLGFLTMQEILKRKFKLKSIIVKNFEETKAKNNQQELWRYRALAGGFYVFKHEYIFLFQKKAN